MVNVFSFCLYGPGNPIYYPGMLENVYLAGKHFPTWKVYIYYAPDVETSMINHLGACSNVVLFPTGITGEKNMIRRFFAIDEPGVDVMFVRDADSRIHWKDRWAIRGFVASHCIAHTIRDNVEHTAVMMGGLWGLKKSAGIHLQTEYSNYIEDESRGFRNAHDQNFLADVIYPIVLSGLLVHFSVAPVFSGEEHRSKFPFDWSNDIYCGRVETNYVDMPEPKLMRVGFLPPALLRMHDVPAVQVMPPPLIVAPEQLFIPSKPKTHTLHFLNKK